MSKGKLVLTDLAAMVRSKNAGPFLVSLDLVFPDRETYAAVTASRVVSRRSIAELYQVPIERVSEVIEYPAANSLKVNLLRERPSGSVGERDVYGSQQHPLLDLLPAPSVPIGLRRRDATLHRRAKMR